MAITITAIGTTLQISVLDEDFRQVQDFLRSSLSRGDLTGRFDRYNILRYTGGKLVSSSARAARPLLPELADSGTFDTCYRPPKDSASTYDGPQQRDDYGNVAMEFLGRPGPSFYYDFQEDEITEAQVIAAATAGGWPPVNWPYSRYSRDLCFSPWLTIPGAAQKVWVDQPCVARLTAMGMGALTFSSVGEESVQIAGANTHYGYTLIDNTLHDRNLHPNRFALVVDTNPILYADEFANTNPNIKDPVTGATAPYRSWKVLKEKAFHCGQRQSIKLAAEVALQGGRYYNFSFKYRDGSIRGWVGDGGALLGPTFLPEPWPSGSLLTRDATVDANWQAEYTARFSAGYFGGIGWWPKMPFVSLWESAGLSVELFYNRASAYRTTSTDPDFYLKHG